MQADTAPVRLFPFPQNSHSENHQQLTRATPLGPCSFIANCRKSAGRTTGGGRVKSRRLSKATPLGPHRIIANPVFSLRARVRLGSAETQRGRFEGKRGGTFRFGGILGGIDKAANHTNPANAQPVAIGSVPSLHHLSFSGGVSITRKPTRSPPSAGFLLSAFFARDRP
jgi:hypothetical protein